jgi:hypothetical protein
MKPIVEMVIMPIATAKNDIITPISRTDKNNHPQTKASTNSRIITSIVGVSDRNLFLSIISNTVAWISMPYIGL